MTSQAAETATRDAAGEPHAANADARSPLRRMMHWPERGGVQAVLWS
jgi:hypothetical protein